tara:strand:- start:19093 stop:21147 length:2055 start_codon:yes stop_codon:yes gene_type:complete
MAFDLSTAQPEQMQPIQQASPPLQGATGGFDMSTAQPEQVTEPQAQQEQDVTFSDIGEATGGLAMEAVAGANRSIAGLVDFFTMDQINNIRQALGDEALPTLSEAISAPKGHFSKGTIGEGLPTDIAAGVGEFAVGAAGGQGLLRQGVKMMGPAASTGAKVLQTMAAPTVQSAAKFGAVSGAGSEVGREIAGEPGAIIGSIVAPVAGIAALGGVKNAMGKLATKFGKNISLIDQATSMPTPAFQKALDKRGLQFGSIIDDVDVLPFLKGNTSPDEAVTRILKRKLLDGATDDVTATIRLEGNKVVPDMLGEEAMKQGFKAGNIAAAKTMNKNTKLEAEKMVSMTRKILANSSNTDKFRPTDVVGENVMKRFNFIRGRADTLRNELNSMATKQAAGDRALGGPGVVPGLKGQQINARTVEDAVLGGLEKLKLKIPDEIMADTTKLNSYLKTNDAFAGSLISENPSSKGIIRKSIKLLSEPGKVDASRAHDLKRQLDEMIDFNKSAKSGLTESGRSFAKTVRSSLNEAIRAVNPKYAQINDELSSSIQSMVNFQKAMGPSIDVFDRSAAKAVGQDLRGLLSNRKSRVKLDNVINSINDVSNQLGGKFDVDVKHLTRFANTLDDRFGAVADTSLKGEVTGAVNAAARGKAGLVDLAAQKVAEQAEKLRGVNDNNALNIMQKILMRNK